MLSEEEKQAVKNFEDLLKKHFEETSVTSGNFLEGTKGILILNIIEKQQKEIERLKEFEKYYENEKVVWQRKDYISKDKIRELKEKYRDDYMTININNRSAGKTFKQAVYYEVRKVIDELLGE